METCMALFWHKEVRWTLRASKITETSLCFFMAELPYNDRIHRSVWGNIAGKIAKRIWENSNVNYSTSKWPAAINCTLTDFLTDCNMLFIVCISYRLIKIICFHFYLVGKLWEITVWVKYINANHSLMWN